MNYKLLIKSILLTFALTIFSCENEREITEEISEESIKALTQTKLEEINTKKLSFFDDSNNDRRDSNINLLSIQEKLVNYDINKLNFSDLSQILGNDYNEVYFKNIQLLQAVSVDILNSELLSQVENENKKQEYAKLIFENLLKNSELDGITSNLLLNTSSRLGCNDPTRYRNCERRASADHEQRMTQVTIAAAVSTIGSPLAGGVVLVTGMIGSGIQYDRAVDYCDQQFCVAQ